MWSALLAFLGGAINHIRGGWLALPHTQLLRAAFSLPLGGLAWFATGDPWTAAVGLLVFLGMLPGWGNYFDLGRMNGNWLPDFLFMTVRGLLVTGPAGALLGYLGYGWWFAPAGLLMGAFYEAGWRTPTIAPQFESGPPIAEVYFGSWVWLALGLSLGLAGSLDPLLGVLR